MARAIEEFCFADRKIAMVSGPRQCGKTTLGKTFLKKRAVGHTFNWDEFEFRHAH